jgi:WhiB family transcriptional regulator, redox-sensing transcriptional regulator
MPKISAGLDAATAVTAWLMTPGAGEELPSFTDLIKRPVWMSQAACRGDDLDLFFPQRGVAATTMAWARKVCAGCPVRLECHDFAEADAEIIGVWDGTTKQERQASRRVVAVHVA